MFSYQNKLSKSSTKLFLIGLIILTFLLSAKVWAQRAEYVLELKNHLFYPQTITIPANTKVKLVIYNRDNSVEEFDSFDLNREKVIFPKQKAVIFIGPLPPGKYNFFGEFNPNTARGTVVIKIIGGEDVN